LALLLALPVLALLPAALQASSPSGPPDGTYSYTIRHSEHGKLGRHVITVSTDGEVRRIAAERHLKVEKLLITVYREDTTIEEVWQAGVLQSYRRHSDFGDEVTELSATLGADGLTVKSDGKSGT